MKKNKYGVNVGDLFIDIWGYEQTNVDFYQVIATRGETQIVLRAVKHTAKTTGFCTATVKAIKDRFIESSGYITRLQHGSKGIIRSVKKYGNEIVAGSEFLHLTAWDSEHTETSYY